VTKKQIDVLFSKEQIDARISELAAQIETDFAGGDMVVVGVLKGSFIFMSDLIRKIKRPLACDFIRVASYEHDKDTGIVRMEFDMTQPVEGKKVLLVEDIVDSGKTLVHLRRHVQMKGPEMFKVATLLYKGVVPESRVLVDYIGFESPHRYVVGYGLDSLGLYRSLPYIGAFR
jgi:hypoxanthine phosphoribosyltransferase